jgi:hypothetical protein
MSDRRAEAQGRSDLLVLQKEGEDSSAVHSEVMQIVRANFRPEFLNRVDEIILFHRLRREDMGAIVDIQLARLAKLLEEASNWRRSVQLFPRTVAASRKPTIRAGSIRRDFKADINRCPVWGGKCRAAFPQASVRILSTHQYA